MEGGGGRVDSPKGGAAGSPRPVIDKTLDPLVKKWMDEKTTETKEKVHRSLYTQYLESFQGWLLRSSDRHLLRALGLTT